MRKVKKRKKAVWKGLVMATVPKRGGSLPSIASVALVVLMIAGATTSEQTFYGKRENKHYVLLMNLPQSCLVFNLKWQRRRHHGVRFSNHQSPPVRRLARRDGEAAFKMRTHPNAFSDRSWEFLCRPFLFLTDRVSVCLLAAVIQSVILMTYPFFIRGTWECSNVYEGLFLVAVGQHRFDAVYTLPCICMSLHSVFLT